MLGRILPFFVTHSQEKLTDRGSLALVDEFMTGIGFTRQLDQVFPLPGSGRGILSRDYVCTLVFHFTDEGRHLEGIEALKRDGGFRSLIRMKHMPGSDAVGDWLRRLGRHKGSDYIQKMNDTLVRRYTRVSEHEEFVLDVDSTVIESYKGDAIYTYQALQGYHSMLGWLSDGQEEPICSYVKFRPGSASAQADILEALQHIETLIPAGKRIQYFRSDSAASQAKIIDYCNDNHIDYTITADKDAGVMSVILDVPTKDWQPLHDRRDGFKTGREVAQTVHTMNASHHSFRLVVVRELNEKPDLFGPYSYHAIITNIPADGPVGKTPEEIVWHHNGRGNCERYIEDTKYGLTLRYVPCGQFEANLMYYTLGILTFNLLKLMQMMVLPKSWLKRTVLSLRRKLFRFVAKVSSTSRQLFLQINKTLEDIRQLIRVREKIWALTLPDS